MSSEARKLLKAALRLPAKDRAVFVGSLLRSLDEQVDADSEAQWGEEIARRVKNLDAGKTKLVPWREVKRKLYGRSATSSHGRR